MNEIESLQKRSEKNVLSEGHNLSENPAAIVTNDLSQQINSPVSIEQSTEDRKFKSSSNNSSSEDKLEITKQPSPTDAIGAALFNQVTTSSEPEKIR